MPTPKSKKTTNRKGSSATNPGKVAGVARGSKNALPLDPEVSNTLPVPPKEGVEYATGGGVDSGEPNPKGAPNPSVVENTKKTTYGK